MSEKPYSIIKNGPCWSVIGPNLPPNQCAWGAKSRAAWIAKALNAAPVDHVALIAELKAELAELQAIVAKLPKTADGVPIVPGMTVWKRANPVAEGRVEWLSPNGAECSWPQSWSFYYGNQLYSTLQAASRVEGGDK